MVVSPITGSFDFLGGRPHIGRDGSITKVFFECFLIFAEMPLGEGGACYLWQVVSSLGTWEC